MTSGSEVSILIAFSAGLLSFFSPCVLPLFPSYITYITGRSFEEIKDQGQSSDTRRLAAMHSLFFIAGFSIVFIFLGVMFSYLGSFFGIRKTWLERAGGVIIILFGLHMTGALKIRFLNQEKLAAAAGDKKRSGYFGSLAVGAIFAFGWTPCVGPVLSSILIYASTLEGMSEAVLLLAVYSLGLGIPFFLSGIAINKFLLMFNRIKGFMKAVPVVSGIFLILIGGLLFSGMFSRLGGLF
ncbi:MAG: cytochrome c biogenesis protein CcdA [Candidatus Omnitrophota bacterium]